MNTDRDERERRRWEVTHVVEAAQFVHQPVELEQVQVPVAQNRPLIDRSSYGGECRKEAGGRVKRR